MDETFINNLTKELQKIGTIHSVGEEWVSPTNEIPNGGVPYSGQTVTRVTYSALWDYVQEKGLVKTESEWQTLSNSGDVKYFSDGDGSTTFRMPKISGIMHGIYAFGQTTELGELDATTLATEIANVDNNKLSLSGGTMTNAIKFSKADAIERTVDNSYTAIRGGSAYAKGASLVLYGKDEADGSRFRLIAHDGEKSPNLIGKSDGALTWDGNDIITSAGGFLSGALEFSSTDGMIRKTNDTTRMVIRGSTAFEGGGSLYLNGKSYSSNAGGFQIYAHDGTTSKCLLGLPDGTLKWDGKSVTKKFVGPTTVSSASYTATNDGFLIGVRSNTANAITMKGYSNGILVAYSYDHHASAPWVIVPYKAGDAVSITVSNATNIKYYKMEIA